MTTAVPNLPQPRTWRNALAARWAAFCAPPVAIRIIVLAMATFAASMAAVALRRAIMASVVLSVALYHFGFGQPTRVEAKLAFLDDVYANARSAGLILLTDFLIACAAGFIWNLYRRDFRAHLWSLLKREFFLAHCMITSAILVLAALYLAYRNYAALPPLRTDLCVAAIVAAVGSTICLAGALHYFDLAIAASPRTEWFLRWPTKLYKRLVLVAQFATTALALGAAGILIFDLKIPGIPP